jgi:hypothetical protein
MFKVEWFEFGKWRGSIFNYEEDALDYIDVLEKRGIFVSVNMEKF